MSQPSLSRNRRAVSFYTRPNCPLCDDARDILLELEREHPMEVTEVNILSDPATYERYKYQIPVIVIDGCHTVWGRVEKDALNKFLAG